MANPTDQFKVHLNQNLWGLVLGLVALGCAEYYKLCVLFWFGALLSGVMVISVTICTIAYTINYWSKKQGSGVNRS